MPVDGEPVHHGGVRQQAYPQLFGLAPEQNGARVAQRTGFLDGLDEGVSAAALAGIPTPAFSSSLAYYDGLRRDRLPAALIQGLRDNFGAHTYRRVDRDGAFHVEWAGDRAEHDA